ncbi:MAG: bifunctional 5,10-methylenetetrahydrofolate dehydrogenase/5,10-methenyltetrahydrofolate cyclohydrolase [Candidatus Thermoplasmatota archaeon]|nr:bifunctional 5,10-methylenetetrahydrofolate dehydrogenase/5,10-methenyltetrahydrofolate cyclohydrolase [Candidatus Thermoplasmatota archaeon]
MQQTNSTQIVSGKDIAQQIKNQVKTDVESITKQLKRKPQVKSFIVGDNKESKLYLKLRNKACFEVGIKAVQHEFSEAVTFRELANEIEKTNSDDQVDGIFVQLPLPKHLDAQKVLSCIHPSKDVEGFTAENMGRLVNNDPFLVPCTPRAVMHILNHHQIPLKGSHVVIINHSTVVGKPLALLCLHENATVSVAHVFTTNLKAITSQADVLITAAGVPNLITKEMIKKDAVIIDVAIVKTEKGITGDVDFKQVKEKASLITPVPGGVGPVTIASALQNIMKATNASLKVKYINE